MKSIPSFLKPWLVAFLAIMLGWFLRSNVDNASPAQLLFDIPLDQVSTIQLEKAGRTLVFERVGDAWQQTQPYVQSANPVAIRQMLVAMAEARVLQTSQLSQLPARAGLDESAPHIKVTWPNGSATLRVGKSHPAGLAWLADVEKNIGGPGSSEMHRLLVDGDPVQLRSARLFDRSGAESDRVIVQANSGTKRLEIVLEKKDGRWSLIEPIEARADNVAVADFLEAVARLEHEGFIDDSPNDLALFGLTQPAATIAIRSLDVSKGVVTEEILEIGGDGAAGPGGRFGKRRDRPGVFQLEKRSLSTLFPPSAAFIDATMLGVDPAEIKSIALQNANGEPTAQLVRNVTQWQLVLPTQLANAETGNPQPANMANAETANTQPANMQRVRDVLQTLCTARASDLATEMIPQHMVVAKMLVTLSSGATIQLVVGKDSQGRWLVGDGGNLTRVYPATLAFPIEPALFGSSNR